MLNSSRKRHDPAARRQPDLAHAVRHGRADRGLRGAVFLWQVSLPPDALDAALYGYGMIPAVLFGEREQEPGEAEASVWLLLTPCRAC